MGEKASSVQFPLLSGKTSVFLRVYTTVLHIDHLVMIIADNLHNSDNLHIQLQISFFSPPFLAQSSSDGIRSLFFSRPCLSPPA